MISEVVFEKLSKLGVSVSPEAERDEALAVLQEVVELCMPNLNQESIKLILGFMEHFKLSYGDSEVFSTLMESSASGFFRIFNPSATINEASEDWLLERFNDLKEARSVALNREDYQRAEEVERIMMEISSRAIFDTDINQDLFIY
jgi:hypothetical protein